MILLDHSSCSTDNLFALDLGSLDKGWKELSFMLSKRVYVATVTYHSKYFCSFLTMVEFHD